MCILLHKILIIENIFVLAFITVKSQATKTKIGSGYCGRPDENGVLVSFSDDFSSNGFKRLINNGYTFQNMHFNFMPTYTGPGHASIYTGTTPDTHGM
jgi:hypothetical protein